MVATLLSDADRERLKQAVSRAESKTAGEIRILVAGRSVARLRPIPGLLGLVGAAAAFAILHHRSWGHPDAMDLAFTAAAGLVTLAAASLLPPFAGEADRAVRRRAEREFVEMGMGATSGRTGVLIFLSQAEHRAVVLADRAIHEKVEPGTWKRELDAILAGIREGHPADGLERAVDDVGRLLAKHFPRRDDDVNELPDDVVTKR